MASSQPALTAVYLDTSVVVPALFHGHVHFAACRAFVARLVNDRSHVHFSQILWLELSQVLTHLPHDPGLALDLRRAYRLDRWERNVAVRERWLATGLQWFNDLIARFDRVTEAPFSRAIWEASLDIMAQHQLRSHDAIHVATARAVGIRDFATLDGHFRRVPDLHLWLI